MTVLYQRCLFVIVLLILVLSHAAASQQEFADIYRDISYGKYTSVIKHIAVLPDRHINYPIDKTKGQALIHLAVSKESGDDTSTLMLVEELLKKGADVNLPNDKGESPIFYVGRLKTSQNAVFDLLIKNGADINKVDIDGDSPLHRYIKLKNTELIKRAIAVGADVSAFNKIGTTLFMQAAAHHNEAMDLLSSAGADPRSIDSIGNTALHYATKYRKMSAIDYLLNKGLDIDKQNTFGETALSILASDSKWSVVRILLEKGANPYVPMRRNHTVAYYLITHPELGMAELIDKSKVNVNTKMDNGVSLLFQTINTVDLRMLEQLVDLGVDVNQTFAPNYPAIPFIAEKDPKRYKDALPMLKRLIELGADINARKMGMGATGLGVAAEQGRKEVVDILLKHGAIIDNRVVLMAVESKNYSLATQILRHEHKLDMEDTRIWSMIENISNTIERNPSANETVHIEKFLTKVFEHKPTIDLRKANNNIISDIRKRLENSSSIVVLNAIAKARFIERITSGQLRKPHGDFSATKKSELDPIMVPVRNYSQAANLHVIGVYEGVDERNGSKPWWANCMADPANPPSKHEMRECHKKYSRQHKERKVVIRVSAKRKPVILALMAYEPIQWIVEKGNGVKIEAVILAGYYGQRISGIGSAVPVDVYTHHHSDCNNCQVGDGFFYAYSRKDNKFTRAMQRLETITKRSASSFQGRYSGKSFTVIDSN